MTNIYLDLESIPCQLAGSKEEFSAKVKAPGQYKKQDSIDAWLAENREAEADAQWRRTSFDGGLGHIAVIGFSIDDGDPVALYSENYASDEKTVIRSFYDAINDAVEKDLRGGYSAKQSVRFVGHNVSSFDLRFLFQRSVVLGIKPPSCIPFKAKPWEDSIFDTMSEWAGFGNKVALSKLVDVLGLQEKGAEIGEEIDGSMVWDFVKDGKIKQVAEYCKGDVIRTREAYKKLTFL